MPNIINFIPSAGQSPRACDALLPGHVHGSGHDPALAAMVRPGCRLGAGGPGLTRRFEDGGDLAGPWTARRLAFLRRRHGLDAGRAGLLAGLIWGPGHAD